MSDELWCLIAALLMTDMAIGFGIAGQLAPTAVFAGLGGICLGLSIPGNRP